MSGPNIVDFNQKKAEIEKYILDMHSGSVPQDTYLNFITEAFQNLQQTIEKIEQTIVAIQAENNEITNNNIEGIKSSMEDFIRYFEEIFTTIQALVETSKHAIPNQINNNFLNTIQSKLNDIDPDSTQMEEIFAPLLEKSANNIIDNKLRQGVFKELLKEVTEDYSNVNEKIENLDAIFKNFQNREITTKEELFRQIQDIQAELKGRNNDLYVELASKIREVEKEHEGKLDDIEKTYQEKYDEIIHSIEGKINHLSKDENIKTLKPLVLGVIRFELENKGTFRELLRKTISEMSETQNIDLQAQFKQIVDNLVGKEKFRELLKNTVAEMSSTQNIELQIQFKQIVNNLVGKGTKLNEKMAKENTQLGLRRMSDTDIEEALGSSILKIVENKYGLNEEILGIPKKITEQLDKFREQQRTPKENAAQQFFDGLSFSIYYYIIIKNGKSTTNKEKSYLPQYLKNYGDDINFISEFEKIAKEIEIKRKHHLDQYKNYTKPIMRLAGKPGVHQEDVCCFMQYHNDIRIYLFSNQEPSNFFKKKLDEIVKNNIDDIDDIDDIEGKLEELIDNYALPQVELAVFNANGLELPLNDGNSVISSIEGNKFLTLEEEDELINLIPDITEKITRENDKKTNKLWHSIFSKNKIKSIHGTNGLWFYWVDLSSKKYLAIKLKEEFLDEKNKYTNHFFEHVDNAVWKNLVNTNKKLERQAWIDSFTQKDGIPDRVESTSIKYFLYMSWVLLKKPRILLVFTFKLLKEMSKKLTLYITTSIIVFLMLFSILSTNMFSFYFPSLDLLNTQNINSSYLVKSHHIAEKYKIEINQFKMLKAKYLKLVNDIEILEFQTYCNTHFIFTGQENSHSDLIKIGTKKNDNAVRITKDDKDYFIKIFDGISNKLNNMNTRWNIHFFPFKNKDKEANNIRINWAIKKLEERLNTKNNEFILSQETLDSVATGFKMTCIQKE